MKLNLLPKSVSKGVASKGTMVFMGLIVVASLAVAFLYNQKLKGDLQSYKTEAEALKVESDKVVAAYAQAHAIVANARVVLTNTSLVRKIDEQNLAYVQLYDDIKPFVPSFFRVRSMTARSAGAAGAVVTINGYLKSFQQYSDIMIALLRFETCTSIGRGGFGPIADGNEGPFGYNPDVSDRGPMPGWSAITITMNVAGRNLQAPNPMPTLQAGSAGGAAPAGTGAAPRPAPIAAPAGGA